MILKISGIGIALLSAFTVFTAEGSDFIDTSMPDKLITYGVRVGLNTSNQTSPSKSVNLDSWGTGFDAGVVVDLNFRDFFAIQPGFFFESRSHNYSYVDNADRLLDVSEYGHTRSYWFNIPLLASFRINPANSLKVSIDAGPQFGFGIGGSDKGTFENETGLTIPYDDGYFDIRKKFVLSFKMGAGIRYADHYYFGIHYQAGTGDVYKNGIEGGNHKAWTFTLGYDF